MSLDLFTQKRFTRFIQEFRHQSGQLPTIKDFESGGFDRKVIEAALKIKLIEEFYVTLTSGTIVKAYKLSQF